MRYLPRCNDQWTCWNQLLGILIGDCEFLSCHFLPSCGSRRYQIHNRLGNRFEMSNQWCPSSWSNHIYHKWRLDRQRWRQQQLRRFWNCVWCLRAKLFVMVKNCGDKIWLRMEKMSGFDKSKVKFVRGCIYLSLKDQGKVDSMTSVFHEIPKTVVFGLLWQKTTDWKL